MTPSDFAAMLTRMFIERDGDARVSISDDWMLRVDSGRYSVGVRLSREERTPDAAVSAIRSASLWGWSIATPRVPTVAATSQGQSTGGIPRHDESPNVVAFAEAPLDEVGRAAIRDAILEELAETAGQMRADVRGSAEGWWTIRLTRTSDRRSYTGVVSARTEQPGVLRKLTRSLLATLNRQRD